MDLMKMWQPLALVNKKNVDLVEAQLVGTIGDCTAKFMLSALTESSMSASNL